MLGQKVGALPKIAKGITIRSCTVPFCCRVPYTVLYGPTKWDNSPALPGPFFYTFFRSINVGNKILLDVSFWWDRRRLRPDLQFCPQVGPEHRAQRFEWIDSQPKKSFFV